MINYHDRYFIEDINTLDTEYLNEVPSDYIENLRKGEIVKGVQIRTYNPEGGNESIYVTVDIEIGVPKKNAKVAKFKIHKEASFTNYDEDIDTEVDLTPKEMRVIEKYLKKVTLGDLFN